jgi:integrase
MSKSNSSMNDLVAINIPAEAKALVAASDAELAARASQFVKNSKAARTLAEYRRCWSDFANWCDSRELVSLPASPETAGLYLADLAGRLKYSSIAQRCAAINGVHIAHSVESPTKSATVRLLLQGVRRTIGIRQEGKPPALASDIKRVVDSLADDLCGIRDRALLTLAVASGLRRSELCNLDVADVRFEHDGLVLLIRKSKTDQQQQWREIGINYASNRATCPVRSVQTWIERAGISSGALFRALRHGKLRETRLRAADFSRVVKRHLGADFSAHSTRSGHCTSAALGGASELEIKRTTGHRSSAMVQKYIRFADLFKNSTAKIW